MTHRRLAVVTGASSGIGFELARIAAASGYDLLLIANEPIYLATLNRFRGNDASILSVEADLATTGGITQVVTAIRGRPVDILCANAGTALGEAFLEQPVAAWRHVVDTNVFGTTALLHRLLPDMVIRKSGRVLVTGSINGSIPGPFLAVYNASKAYLNNLTDALRDELRNSDVTLTTLMPGPVETPIYARAGMLDTFVGAISKPGPAAIARVGWDAMQRGKAHIVPGLLNKVVEATAHVVPSALTAAVHRAVAAPKLNSKVPDFRD